MHFSVLPLLLLFASTICASPAHIERRLNVFGIELPNDYRKNLVYQFSETIKTNNVPFVGIPGALKTERDIPHMQITYIYVEIVETRIKPMMEMISHLSDGHKLPRWGWDFIEAKPHNFIAFVLEAKREAEEWIRQYWHDQQKTLDGGLMNMGLR